MICIIDYGMGNIRSVHRALERAGGETKLVSTPDQLSGADKIVLPGVAAFEDAMTQLRSQELLDLMLYEVRCVWKYFVL
ncbi:MAG: hypothetical protein QGH94_20200, partial [Phycisphaerae bacterium]|nr:hypothetical protein [Phycisphaerae bacterium]